MTDGAGGAGELGALQEENERLRRRVRRLRARSGRQDLGYVFIVTYGRSGSTLVQGLLNAIPGYLVRGENGDALLHLYEFHQRLVTEVARSARTPRTAARHPTNPWFGMIDVPLDRSLEGIRALALSTVLRPEPDTRVTGFKEIRWYRADLDAYVDWLRRVFPGARVVINTRNLDDVMRSAWWAKTDPDARTARLGDIERRIRALADTLGDAAYHLHYDDFVADPTVLRGFYDWLGEPWDEASVRATLAVRHSI